MIRALFSPAKRDMGWLPDPPRKLDFASDFFTMSFVTGHCTISLTANPVEFLEFLRKCQGIEVGSEIEIDEPLSGDIFRGKKISSDEAIILEQKYRLNEEEIREIMKSIEDFFVDLRGSG